MSELEKTPCGKVIGPVWKLGGESWACSLPAHHAGDHYADGRWWVDSVCRPPATTASTKITVALVPKAAQDLEDLHKRFDSSTTDLVNRAITLANFVTKEQEFGGEFLLNRPDGTSYLVRLIWSRCDDDV